MFSSTCVTVRMRWSAMACRTSRGAWVSMSREAGIKSIPVRGMYLSIGETPINAKVDCPSIVAKRMGDSCTQVGEPGSENRQTRRSPAHSCHKDSFASVQQRLQESTELLHPITQVAKPGRHWGDGADYKPHRNSRQGEGF